MSPSSLLPGRPRAPRSLFPVTLATLLLALGTAAPAHASSATKILEACGEGKLPSGYSQQAYRQALRQMPPELSEYSDCSDLIHKAQLAAAAHGGGSSGGPGEATGAATAVAPPTPTEQRTLERVSHTGSAPVQVGGETIRPGVVHANIASALSALPTPLLTLLAFLLACALTILGWTVRNYVRARRHDT